MTEFILSVASVANGATTLKLIHSLLGDSYGCVNHACGAIDPLSRVEYKPVSPPLVLKKLRIREEIYLSDLPTLRSEDEE